ncbi:TonB-dependent siderophore receptor [Dysgonomonas sp. 520]|uniref:TonB-dependent receptor plug domain-containing protein n=1 Tax=Dysgonomonas sp. 520 TaxID=2302931 RepID=UPI0013D5AC05|nr:TonB-dependent receptor plug domain-containing protein [Dysgonomonas sp. 520]NDW09349.1 TonB-dependent receptor [Dysgonomonas sp. 520]
MGLFYRIISLSIVLLAGTVFAQQNDSISIKQDIDNVEIVTSAKPNSIKAVSPLQVLTIETIEKIGIVSVSDAVRHFTGVMVRDYGGIGGLKTVSLRGFGAQHTAVSYDGITLNDAQAGMIDIGRFSLDNVSMLTLTHGQSDNIFQPARNFSSIGVLNIETRKPLFSNRRYEGKVRLGTGSFGLFTSSLDFSYKLNNKFALDVNGGWQRADGKYPYEMSNIIQVVEGKRINSDVDILRTEVNLYGNLSDSEKLQVKTYFYNSDMGVPGAVILRNPYSASRLNNRNFFTQIQYCKSFTDKFSYKPSVKYNYDYAKYTDDQSYGKTKDEFIQNELYVSNAFLYQLSKSFSISLAEDLAYSEMQNDSIKNNILKNPKRKTSLTSIASKFENERLTVTGSLFATYSQDKVVASQKSTYKRITPSLAMSYAILKGNKLRFRISYKDIFRIPSMTEAYCKQAGQPLKPEKARQLNTGLVLSTRLSETLDYLSVNVDAYWANVRDKIIIIPNGVLSSTSNKGKVRMSGFDTNINLNINLSEDMRILINGGYSFLEAIDITGSASTNKSYKDQIPYTPKHSGSASLSFDNPWVNFSYSLLASGKCYAKNQNLKENRVDGYTDHSISLAKELKLRSNKVSIQFSLLNILNKNYQIIKSYPMPGRSFRVTAGINF